MNNTLAKTIIIVVEMIITILLITAIVLHYSKGKETYKTADKKYGSMSYVEKSPHRDEYPFEEIDEY